MHTASKIVSGILFFLLSSFLCSKFENKIRGNVSPVVSAGRNRKGYERWLGTMSRSREIPGGAVCIDRRFHNNKKSLSEVAGAGMLRTPGLNLLTRLKESLLLLVASCDAPGKLSAASPDGVVPLTVFLSFWTELSRLPLASCPACFSRCLANWKAKTVFSRRV